MTLPLEISADDRVFVLTGAGISAESGLATFRDSDGLWAGHAIEDVCTPEAWDRNAELVWQFYSARREAAALAVPNAAHIALAEFEGRLGDRFFLCTQNVDDLHEKAGSGLASGRLVHMHGELFVSRCSEECGAAPVVDDALYASLGDVAKCGCGALLRPHIVWFGETPMEMDRIAEEIRRSTVMLVVGTSGSVYPAANFVRLAKGAGARTVYVGVEAPLNASAFSQVVLGKAGVVLPELLADCKELQEAYRYRCLRQRACRYNISHPGDKNRDVGRVGHPEKQILRFAQDDKSALMTTLLKNGSDSVVRR
jgi:NAD-dependent deacetylase